MQKENTFGVTNERMVFLGVKNILHIVIRYFWLFKIYLSELNFTFSDSSVGAILQGLESTFNFAPGVRKQEIT